MSLATFKYPPASRGLLAAIESSQLGQQQRSLSHTEILDRSTVTSSTRRHQSRRHHHRHHRRSHLDMHLVGHR